MLIADLPCSCFFEWCKPFFCCQVKSVWPRFMLDAVRAGSALVNLLPSRTSRWWPLIEDVFMSDKAIELRNTILAECVAHGEFTAISIDGTFRVCLSIMGQLPFNMSKELRQKAAFKDDESIRRVITVRGKTGAVVAMFGAPGEGAADLRRGLENNLPTAALHQIQYLATDAPSVKLLEELKETLPNLEGISLDPVHLAMHYESASARKKTAGSATLRKCLAKFGHSKSMPPPATWGAFFTGAEDGQLSARERVLRDQIVDGSMAQTKARKILESLDAVTYWPTRTCFIETLAAISAVYRAEVTKKSDEGKPLTDLLWNATKPDRLGWLFKNLRVRSRLSKAENLLLPTGTTSNESLHAEINNWFRQTQSLHKSTLSLKLKILVFSKLIAHNTSLYSPGARQMSSSHVLARRIGTGLWTMDDWKGWACKGKAKASLPIEQQRRAESHKVKKIMAKRPARRLQKPAAKVHRTPFTLSRAPGVRRAGVHKRWHWCARFEVKSCLALRPLVFELALGWSLLDSGVRVVI